jgi:hypothetical protein
VSFQTGTDMVGQLRFGKGQSPIKIADLSTESGLVIKALDRLLTTS